MSNGPNDDDIQQLIMMILGTIGDQQTQIEGAGIMFGAISTLLIAVLPQCDDEECNHAAMHRCGGSHKLSFCDHHLAEHLVQYKNEKSVFDTRRNHFKEVPYARALTTLENFLVGFSEHSSMCTLH